jgi:hypothetical protein
LWRQGLGAFELRAPGSLVPEARLPLGKTKKKRCLGFFERGGLREGFEGA